MKTLLTFGWPSQGVRERCSPVGRGSPAWYRALLRPAAPPAAPPPSSCSAAAGLALRLQPEHPPHPQRCYGAPGTERSAHRTGTAQPGPVGAVSTEPENGVLRPGWVCLPVFHTADGSVRTRVQERRSVDEGFIFSTRTVYSKETFVSVIHSLVKCIKTRMAS